MEKPTNKNLTRWVLRLLFLTSHYADYLQSTNEEVFQRELTNSVKFFCRFQNKVNFRGKTVLDIGCGIGAICYYMALNGAKKVVGIDINKNSIDFAKSKLKEYPLANEVLTFALPKDARPDKYDMVLSKDSFEHYDDPENFIVTMQQYLKPSGKLIIGFSPLWKSPFGGHIKRLTRVPLPWVHLVFPERILMAELRRSLQDESLESFRQIAGGLNKMTLDRFLKLVESQRLEFEYIKTNVGSTLKDRFALSVFKIICLIPGLEEYFTVNLYSILRAKNSEP
jgi:SAM-dependent methyltransferase